MEESLSHIFDLFATNLWLQGVLIILATCFIEDAARCWVAMIVAHGGIEWWFALGTMTLGGMAGDIGLYLMGRYATLFIIRRRWIDAERLTWVEERFRHHGAKAVFFSRFIPGSRTFCFIAAGAVRYPAPRLLLVDALAAACQALLFLKAVGFISERILPYLEDTRLKVGVFGIIAILLFWAHIHFTRNKSG